jgi:cytochrome b561
MLKDSRTGYGWITVGIHWVSAMLVLFLFGLGVYMVDLGYYDEWYHKGPALHISLGLILLFITVFRLIWRTSNPTPPDLSDKRMNNLAAKVVKISLYGLLFIIFMTGYLITTAEGKPAAIFDVIKIPAITELSADNVDLAGEIHEILAWIIVILSALHAAGALMHHFVLRDRTLVRMLKTVNKSDVN